MSLGVGLSLGITSVARRARRIREQLSSDPTYQNVVLDDGPIAYWRLDDNSFPMKDKQQVGTLQKANETVSPGIEGAINSAIDFPDDTGWVRSEVGYDWGNAFTIEFWILFPSQVNCYVGIGDAADGLDIRSNAAGNTGLFGNVYDGANHLTPETNTDIYDGTWHHVTLTWNGNSVQLWVDGSSIGISGGASPSTGSDEFRINRTRWDAQQNGGYSIDEVAIYDRALKEIEISEHYDLGVGNPISTEYKDTILNDIPIAYWRLDEEGETTASDISGNNHDGTYVDSPTQGENPIVTAGRSVLFSGGSRVTTNFDFDPTNSLSLEAWFNASTVDSNRRMIISDRAGTGSDWSHFLRLDGSTIQFWVKGDDGSVNADSTTSVSTNKDYHIVGTYDGTTMRLYVNGVEEGTAAQSGKDNTDGVTFSIGATDDGTLPFDGRIDEPAVYDRALTSEEIAEHYAVGLGLTDSYGKAVGMDLPISYWRLDETSGTTAEDQTGPLDGTFNGSPVFEVDSPVNQGIDFPNTNDEIEISDNSAFKVTGNFTWELWIKTTESNVNEAVLETVAGNSAYSIQTVGDGTDHIKMNVGGSSNELRSNITINDGNWHHVVFVYTGGDGNGKVFIDGDDQTNTDSSGGPSYTTGPLYIGSAGGRFTALDQSLDEIALYDRALTSEEINEHYLKGINQESNLPILDGLIGHYDATTFSQSDGENVDNWLDRSGKGNHLFVDTTAQPTIIDPWINDLKAVDYRNGDNEVHRKDTINDGSISEFTIFAVTEQTKEGDGKRWIVLSGGEPGAQDVWSYQNDDSFRFNGTSISLPGTDHLQAKLYTFTKNNNNDYERYIDGSLNGSGNVNEFSENDNFFLGDAGGAGNGGYPDDVQPIVGEVVIYNRRLTEQEQANIEHYLSTRWGTAYVAPSGDSANFSWVDSTSYTPPSGDNANFSWSGDDSNTNFGTLRTLGIDRIWANTPSTKQASLGQALLYSKTLQRKKHE